MTEHFDIKTYIIDLRGLSRAFRYDYGEHRRVIEFLNSHGISVAYGAIQRPIGVIVAISIKHFIKLPPREI